MAVAALASKTKQSNGRPCEDAVGKFSKNGVTSIVLCDGAGSKKYSSTGAKNTVKVTGRILTENFLNFSKMLASGQRREVASHIINEVREELRTKRFAKQFEIDEYASTLLFAATDKQNLIVGQLGDGGIVISDGQEKLGFETIKGEFANQTCFTTSQRALTDFQIKTLPILGLKGITLFSDGVASSIIANKTNVIAPAVATMVEWLQMNPVKIVEPALLANLEGHFVERTHDDCSISLMVFE
jgi:hypothetical protein